MAMLCDHYLTFQLCSVIQDPDASILSEYHFPNPNNVSLRIFALLFPGGYRLVVGPRDLGVVGGYLLARGNSVTNSNRFEFIGPIPPSPSCKNILEDVLVSIHVLHHVLETLQIHIPMLNL